MASHLESLLASDSNHDHSLSFKVTSEEREFLTAVAKDMSQPRGRLVQEMFRYAYDCVRKSDRGKRIAGQVEDSPAEPSRPDDPSPPDHWAD